jgi:prepilin peptidase CpaA
VLAEAAAIVIWIGVLCAAAVSDVRTMTIPNRLSLLLVGAFAPLFMASGGDLAGLGAHAITALVVFTVCLGLFQAGWFGGGDAKLLPALALWAGPDAVAHLILGAALAGGLVAAVLPLVRRMAPDGAHDQWGLASLHPEEGVPYAIALAAGGVFALGSISWFEPQTLFLLLTKL